MVASVQGGTFAPGAAVSWCGAWANGARQALARARGAPVYGIVEGDEAMRRLADR